MKKPTIIASILLIVAAFFYLIILGGPVPITKSIGGCKVEYTYYITDNFLCNMQTHGHCSDNHLEKHNANGEIGLCLCEKYESGKSKEDSIRIIEFIHSDKDLINAYEYLVNEKGFRYISVDTACRNKEQLFGPWYIE